MSATWSNVSELWVEKGHPTVTNGVMIPPENLKMSSPCAMNVARGEPGRHGPNRSDSQVFSRRDHRRTGNVRHHREIPLAVERTESWLQLLGR